MNLMHLLSNKKTRIGMWLVAGALASATLMSGKDAKSDASVTGPGAAIYGSVPPDQIEFLTAVEDSRAAVEEVGLAIGVEGDRAEVALRIGGEQRLLPRGVEEPDFAVGILVAVPGDIDPVVQGDSDRTDVTAVAPGQ